MFQSTPVIADGRIATPGTSAWWDRMGFNPRPSLLTGESEPLLCRHAADLCFNPRPSLLTGESDIKTLIAVATGVSIHARHC